MKATKSRDGKYRVTVRIEHRLDLEALTDILAYCVYMEYDVSSDRKAWDRVRNELHSHGHWWHEIVGGDVGPEHVEIARPIAERLWSRLK